MASQFSEDAVAAADKEMEERANRAKELLANRYHGLKNQQVSLEFLLFSAFLFNADFQQQAKHFKRQDVPTHD
jgi:hypothetical protein